MKLNRLLLSVSVIVCLLGMRIGFGQNHIQLPAKESKIAADTSEGIRFFEGTWEQALEQARKEHKQVFMDCYTSWCVPCKRLSKEVFTQPEVGDCFNREFINIKMDMEKGEGKVLKHKYEIDAYPTLYFLDENGEILHRICGAPDKKLLLEQAEFVRKGKGVVALGKLYEAGHRDPESIRQYTSALDIAGRGEEAGKVCLSFLEKLDKGKWKEKVYWDLFQKYVKDYDSKVADYVYRHREEFYAAFGDKEVRKKLSRLWAGGAMTFSVGRDEEAAWDEKGFQRFAEQLMKRDIDNKEVILSDARMGHALKTKDWKSYVELGSERVKAGTVTDMLLYNWGSRVAKFCQDSLLREQAAVWMDDAITACKELKSGEVSFKPFLERVAMQLRRKTITVSGKVAAVSDRDNVIEVICKDGYNKITVDSCRIDEDGSYELKMQVTEPGVYTLRCQKGQTVNFWAENEDVKVDFPGFGKAKFRVVRPLYLHIQGGPDNELMNLLNWEEHRNYLLMADLGRKVYDISNKTAQEKEELANQFYERMGEDLSGQLKYLAGHYSDRHSVLAILAKMRGKEDDLFIGQVLDALAAKNPDYRPLLKYRQEWEEAKAQRKLLIEGKIAPEFSIPTVEGEKQYGPQDFKGKVLVLDFWASWCGPCRAEIPTLKEAYRTFHEKGVEFLSVSMDRNENAWRKALVDEEMPWMQLLAPNAGKAVMKQYQFTGIPYILVLDKEGRIVAKNLRGKALTDKLEELVGGRKKAVGAMSMMKMNEFSL